MRPPRRASRSWLARSPGDSGLRVISRPAWRWSPAVPTKPSAFSGTSSRTIRATWRRTNLLGRMYVTNGDMTRAYAEYQTLAARSPAGAGPRTMAAMIDEARGQREAADRRLRTRARRESPRRRRGE